MSNPKLLLIDANNLCFREFFSKKNLSHKGRSVDVIFGVFKSMISFHKKWPDHFRIMVWDGGYDRRLAESKEAVSKGIIPQSYKQNRREKAAEPDPELEPLFEQIDILESLLDKTKTMQIRIKGYEADDVINSYADWSVRHGGDAVIVSSDKDFYQCLRNGVVLYDARNQDVWTKQKIEMECGFPIELWLDKSAIEGEVGPSKDNIFGVDGWGPVTASKYVSRYGGIEDILNGIRDKEKRGKKEDVFLQQEERVKLAKSLKKMDIVPDLPMPKIKRIVSDEDIKKAFIEWGFASLLKEAWRLA